MLVKLLSASVALLVVFGACSSDEKEPTNAAAGAASDSDAGGQAGAGAPPEPGASGAGGAFDAGGAPAAGGAAGAAGSPPEPEQWLFGTECPQPISRELYTSCTFEATCEALGCGDGLSRWDAEGCDRRCDSDEDCADGQRCRFTVLSGDNCVVGSYPGDCKPRPDGSCDCSWTADCLYPRVCVDAEAYPASLDCAVADATCAELAALSLAIDEGDRGDRSEAELDAIAECRPAMTERGQELDCD